MKLRQLYLSFKNLKWFYFVPLIVLYLFIPLSNLLNFKAIGLDLCYTIVTDTAQRVIPITATWWVFCVLKEYIEGDGNELLYAYLKGKTLGIDILFVFCWYCVHVAVLFFGYSYFFNNMLLEYVRMIVQSFVLVSALYFLIYAFKSTSIAYMMILVYFIMTLFFSKDTILEKIKLFDMNTPMVISMIWDKYLYIILIGGLFFGLGTVLNKHYFK